MSRLRYTLGIALILKNATRTLPRLLASLVAKRPMPQGALQPDLLDVGTIRPIADEIVFVDTGSTDGTYDLLQDWAAVGCLPVTRALARPALEPDAILAPGEGVLDRDVYVGGCKLRFARFGWCQDFAAARNYSFGLLSTHIRGYLDADDWLECDAEGSKGRHLRAIMQGALDAQAHVAEFNFRYDYDLGLEQRHSRFFVWSRGFTWKGRIHEHCVPLSDGAPRGTYNIHDPGLIVHHDKSAAEGVDSAKRNQVIALEAYAELKRTADAGEDSADPQETGRLAYHIGDFARAHLDLATAEKFFGECIALLPGTNYHAMSLQGLTTLKLELGDHAGALREAGALAGTFPELANGTALLCRIHNATQAWTRTAALYEATAGGFEQLNKHAEDTWLTQGWLHSCAAIAYTKLDDITKASEALTRVPAQVVLHPLVKALYTEANVLVMRGVGLARLKDWTDYLIWSCEASKALDVLDNVPPSLARLPAVRDMRANIEAKMHHLDSWEAYQAAYASIPASDFATDKNTKDQIASLVRVQTVVAWAKGLPVEGEPLKVLCVGFHAGIIEQLLLDANPRIHITVADVAPQTSQGFQELVLKYPGRVDGHAMVADHYDWYPEGSEGTFDAATLFEVIEHVPSVSNALHELFTALKAPAPDLANGRMFEGGRLFLSTPISERWVETYLTEPTPVGPPWYGHVRGFDYLSLTTAISSLPFSVEAVLEGHDNVFTVQARKLSDYPRGDLEVRRIAILVPSTPTPFDALSPQEGFLGGSEEAVVKLAAALAAAGHSVQVFCSMPERDITPRVVDDVVYRPVDEFSPSLPVDDVLFWRCPAVAASPALDGARFNKLLWLHDYAYGVPGAFYAKPDGVLVLSENHKRCLQEYDGAPADAPWFSFANGIVEEDFLDPVDDGQRDPHQVIYASSPDRGLLDVLEVWPAVREAIPDARLDIYYDWNLVKVGKPALYAELVEAVEALKDDGVRYLGGVAQPVLHAAMKQAGVWAYPTVGEIETFCITAVKMLAAGVTPVANAAGALPEILGSSVETVPLVDGRTDLDAFGARLISALREPDPLARRQARRVEMLGRFAWSVTAQRLLTICEGLSERRRRLAQITPAQSA